MWACYCADSYVQWTGVGALGYVLLFQGSSALTESLTAEKYNEYPDYQARVGKFVPRLSVKPKGGGKKRSASKDKSSGKQTKSTATGKGAAKDEKKRQSS